ncbi:hypothetical protein ACM66B_003232 [Microbotryomycetes sp. NB124-2]
MDSTDSEWMDAGDEGDGNVKGPCAEPDDDHADGHTVLATTAPTLPSSPRVMETEDDRNDRLQDEIRRLLADMPAHERQGFLKWSEETKTEQATAQEKARQLKEASNDLRFADSLAKFEADGKNWQNSLGRPGQFKGLLKRLLAPAGRPNANRPACQPTHGTLKLIEQRVGQPQSIMNQIVHDSVAGVRMVKVIHTPCLSCTFLIDLLCRLEPAFEKGLHVLLGCSIVQAARVPVLLLGAMRRAEELGGKIMPYFLLEHDRLSTDHTKLALDVDIVTGQAILSVMSWNANNRGTGQEAYHANSPADAPKSFELMFQARYDARDEDSDFWVHLDVIDDGFVQRRALGALIMPTEALFESWLRLPDPRDLFDHDAERVEQIKIRLDKIAKREALAAVRRGTRHASEANQLRTERIIYASAGTADLSVHQAAQSLSAAPSEESTRQATDKDRKETLARAKGLQKKVDEVLVEYPEADKAMSEVAKWRREIRESVAAAYPMPPPLDGARPKKVPGYASKIPKIRTRRRQARQTSTLSSSDCPQQPGPGETDAPHDVAMAEVDQFVNPRWTTDASTSSRSRLREVQQCNALPRRSTEPAAAQSWPSKTSQVVDPASYTGSLSSTGRVPSEVTPTARQVRYSPSESSLPPRLLPPRLGSTSKSSAATVGEIISQEKIASNSPTGPSFITRTVRKINRAAGASQSPSPIAASSSIPGAFSLSFGQRSCELSYPPSSSRPTVSSGKTTGVASVSLDGRAHDPTTSKSVQKRSLQSEDFEEGVPKKQKPERTVANERSRASASDKAVKLGPLQRGIFHKRSSRATPPKSMPATSSTAPLRLAEPSSSTSQKSSEPNPSSSRKPEAPSSSTSKKSVDATAETSAKKAPSRLKEARASQSTGRDDDDRDVVHRVGRTRQGFSSDDDKFLLQQREKGWGWQRIADFLDKHANSVQYRFELLKKGVFHQRRFSKEEDRRLVKLRKKNLSFREIGDKMNRATSSVTQRHARLMTRLKREGHEEEDSEDDEDDEE